MGSRFANKKMVHQNQSRIFVDSVSNIQKQAAAATFAIKETSTAAQEVKIIFFKILAIWANFEQNIQ